MGGQERLVLLMLALETKLWGAIELRGGDADHSTGGRRDVRDGPALEGVFCTLQTGDGKHFSSGSAGELASWRAGGPSEDVLTAQQ